MNTEGHKSSPNNLISEKSPYLLQHAFNPVNWFAWGEKAFNKAKEEDKPIFLSIGYATCHWCHVMERESFEDEEVAKLLNDSFVSIKVDREERPDIDSIYMKVCQMMTQRGGWPLTIIMTPDRKPFFAGTYFPKFGRGGMPGIMDLLTQVAKLWDENRNEILSSTKEILSHLEESTSSGLTSYDSDVLFSQAFTMLSNQFDKKRGGFGSAPKFPSTHRLLFLLRYWKRYKDRKALEMVEKTLSEMRLGGMYDHIGYGFHRYSTDENWKVPHFEKMLYDQAMITLAYTETYQATKNINYKKTAEEIISYVLRDMTHHKGGFFSAEDADSEGVEGKFYTWTKEEISTILDTEDAELYMKIYSFEDKGNFLEEATKEATGVNIPFLQQSLENDLGNTNKNKNKRLEQIRTILFNVREKRVHPLKDDKILTDWNGLMIAALAKSARIFQNTDYLAAAEKSAQFIIENLQMTDGNILHRYREGESAISGNLDDYAFLIWGLLELYEASFKTKYLEYAIELNKTALEKFWDDKVGGFFFTSTDSENLLIREKQIYDGAIPSGNSVALLNLVKLGRILSDPKLEEKADVLMQNFASEVKRTPYAYTFLLSALDFLKGPSFEIVVVGDRTAETTKKMIDAINYEYVPNKIVILKDTKNENIVKIIDILQNYRQVNELPTVYICKQFVCKQPTNDITKMLEQLKDDEDQFSSQNSSFLLL